MSTSRRPVGSAVVGTVKKDGPPSDVTTVVDRSDVADELRRMIRLNRSTFPLGTAACALTLAALAHPYVADGRLLAWMAAGLVCAALFAVALWPPFERHVDAEGLPVLLPAAGYVCGVVFGALPWLDLDALGGTAFGWIVLIILMAVTSGTQSGLINGTRHIVRVTVPAWASAAVAYAVVGRWVVTAAAAVYLAIVVRDAVTSRRFVIAGVEARVHAARQAVTDPLTGLPNRAGLMARLDALAGTPGQAVPGDAAPGDPTSGETVVVLYVDLDGFKAVNDTLGHLAGDALLVEATRRLVACLRPSDVVGRLGGDEFLGVLVLRPGALPDLDDVCTRVLAAMEQPFDVEGTAARVSASIGVAAAPRGGFRTDGLLRRADAALYDAKRSGRGRAVHAASEGPC